MLISIEEDYSLFVWDYVNAYVVQTAHVSGGHVMDVGVNRVRHVCAYVNKKSMFMNVCLYTYTNTLHIALQN